ncbi:MAG: UvrD-helicase domain-containing protein [Planctomycetes bacterium]|nr:UvrD-helicase domain-containing protein [Planctomycetota bacterium]
MAFYADLHVHSRFSRATSRDSDLEHMALWARRKGVHVLGTGDFTHPGWLREIEEKLVPAEPGLFRLRPDLEAAVDRWPGGAGGEPVRFLLEVEVSTIYKAGDRTRKVHHLIYAPDLGAAGRLNASLAKIGNLASDGRPILGLDSRHLLEIARGSGEGCYLVPAHIWTPWFAALGSKSGFDSIEECYGDLAGEIFAVETGLSSDPPMNWRLSRLDRFTLVSNSDAHSPQKIGREACAFECALDYFAIREALRTGSGYGGTVEFFPEEGKYHLDGHRACGVRTEPEETRREGGACRVCGKPLTLGVLHRVSELADRDEGAAPPRPAGYRSLVPLEEVLAEIRGVGPGSKAVQEEYGRLLGRLGPELFVLERAPLEEVARAGSSLLAEGLGRMREGRVQRDAGFDGEYGTIRLFEPGELARRDGLILDLGDAARLPAGPGSGERPRSSGPAARAPEPGEPVLSPIRGVEAEAGADHEEPRSEAMRTEAPPAGTPRGILDALDPDQRRAAEMVRGPLVIVAGPGTGKTRVLTHRIAHLVADLGVPPDQCLAITFTRRAAGEMAERLEALLPGAGRRVPVLTFHALGLSILREHAARLGFAGPPRIAGEAERLEVVAAIAAMATTTGAPGASGRNAERLLEAISRWKRRDPAAPAGAELEPGELAAYDARLRERDAVDLDDLIALPVRLLESSPEVLAACRSRWRWVSVDEIQDADRLQYKLVRLLAPQDGNLCVIGDPDQAIYGFRGADVGCFADFPRDYPSARTVRLERSYRSANAIVEASLEVVAPVSLVAGRRLEARGEGPDRIDVHECSSERAEADLVVRTIQALVGGATFFELDSGRVEGSAAGTHSFADFAVLFRTDSLADPVAEALARAGIPFQRRSHERLGDRPCVRALLEVLRSTGDLTGRGAAARPVLEAVEGAAAEVRKTAPEVEACLPALRLLGEDCGADLTRFLSELALGVDADLWDPRAERVSLLTLHASKGLEFPVVFIAGCEDGVIPLRWGSADRDDANHLAEERRLLFVGMTRARRQLVLTHARRRPWRGEVRGMAPSIFLREVRAELLARERHEARSAAPRSPYKQLTLFGEGVDSAGP